MSINVIQEAKKNHDTVVSWRRTLHQIPELGTDLPQTVAFIAGKLAEMNIPYEVYEPKSCGVSIRHAVLFSMSVIVPVSIEK